MKKSTEYKVGEAVTDCNGVTFTKVSEAEVGQNVNPEIWTNVNGRNYEPTLPFQIGQAEPEFWLL